MHIWRRTVMFGFVLSVLIAALPSWAQAVTLTSSASSYARGENGTAAASNLTATTEYVLELSQPGSTQELDRETTAGSGSSSTTAAFSFTIPTTAALGPATLSIRKASESASLATRTVEITAAATPSPTATPRETDEPEETDRPAPEPRGTARLNVLGDDKFKRGELVKVTAARMTPNENYNLDFAQSPGTIVARGTSNRLGSVRFEFRIPSTARTGSATLTALPADGSGRTASATITIESGSAGGGSGRGQSLPATGRNVAVYTTLAMLLLLGGLSMQRFEWIRRNGRVAAGSPTLR